MQVNILARLFITHALIEEKIPDLSFCFLGCGRDKNDLYTIAGGEKTELITAWNDRKFPVGCSRVAGKGQPLATPTPTGTIT